MPVKIIMEVKHLLIDPICFLINEAFSSGKFPTLLKQATITPIFKNDDPASVSNYRPISVLYWLNTTSVANYRPISVLYWHNTTSVANYRPISVLHWLNTTSVANYRPISVLYWLNTTSVANYKPISVLQWLSKIFEKAI